MRYNEEMKREMLDKLKQNISKKFDTTMIYPLSQFEMAFGKLWGNGKPDEGLTDEERDFKAIWKECRNNILNNGNNQKRNALTELDLHEVSRKRFQATFLPVEQYNKRIQDENY